MKSLVRRWAARTHDCLNAPPTRLRGEANHSQQANTQLLLTLAYQRRVHSQVDEDGILLCLFAVLGIGQRRCDEICAGNGHAPLPAVEAKDCHGASKVVGGVEERFALVADLPWVGV